MIINIIINFILVKILNLNIFVLNIILILIEILIINIDIFIKLLLTIHWWLFFLRGIWLGIISHFIKFIIYIWLWIIVFDIWKTFTFIMLMKWLIWYLMFIILFPLILVIIKLINVSITLTNKAHHFWS